MFIKDMEITRTVFDTDKLKIGNKIILVIRHRKPIVETECVVEKVSQKRLVLRDCDKYCGYKHELFIDEICDGFFELKQVEE